MSTFLEPKLPCPEGYRKSLDSFHWDLIAHPSCLFFRICIKSSQVNYVPYLSMPLNLNVTTHEFFMQLFQSQIMNCFQEIIVFNATNQ